MPAPSPRNANANSTVSSHAGRAARGAGGGPAYCGTCTWPTCGWYGGGGGCCGCTGCDGTYSGGGGAAEGGPASPTGILALSVFVQSGHSVYAGGTSRPHCGQIHVNMNSPRLSSGYQLLAAGFGHPGE